jgi:hypothetical protein
MKNKDYWSIGDDNLCEAMVGLLLWVRKESEQKMTKS